MAQLSIYTGLKKAQAVVTIMETMMDEDAPHDQNIYVGGFNNGQVSGLTLTTPILGRQCNLFGDPGSDCIIAVIGKMGDFNYPDGTAKDTAERYAFSHDEYYATAKFVMIWLTKGEIQNNKT
jgi:hypothetical protein